MLKDGQTGNRHEHSASLAQSYLQADTVVVSIRMTHIPVYTIYWCSHQGVELLERIKGLEGLGGVALSEEVFTGGGL